MYNKHRSYRFKIKLRFCSLAFLLSISIAANSQYAADTGQLIKEFNKVMSFAAEPYVFFTTVTKMNATPVLQERDTIRVNGVFYKKENNLYYSNEVEEMYLEDSLLVQINNERKTIWISKIDVSTKDKMNILPLNNQQLQELFQKRYSVVKSITIAGMVRLDFETKSEETVTSGVSTRIGLEYSQNTLLPSNIEMRVQIQQPVEDEMAAELQKENPKEKSLIQIIGNVKYLMRTQSVNISFAGVSITKDKAMQIPLWTEKLTYNSIGRQFTGRGIYKDYEVTTTF